MHAHIHPHIPTRTHIHTLTYTCILEISLVKSQTHKIDRWKIYHTRTHFASLSLCIYLVPSLSLSLSLSLYLSRSHPGRRYPGKEVVHLILQSIVQLELPLNSTFDEIEAQSLFKMKKKEAPPRMKSELLCSVRLDLPDLLFG